MKYFYIITTIFLIGLSCAKKDSEEKIIARIGDKSISFQEFISRAEFTVRPRIFNSKISVLNNLVAEKLIALDAGKNDKLSQSEQFQAYIKGIQEQHMREQLFYQEAYNKVEIIRKHTTKSKSIQMKLKRTISLLGENMMSLFILSLIINLLKR